MRKFYSVAEHSVLVADYLLSAEGPALAWEGLLHDATEAYLSDMIHPIKRHMTEYREIEARLDTVLRRRFGLPPEMSPQVKEADMRICITERNQLLTPPPGGWDAEGVDAWRTGMAPLNIVLPCWSPEEARASFINRFTRYDLG